MKLLLPSLDSLRLPERIGWRDHVIGAALGARLSGVAPRHRAIARLPARRGRLLPCRRRVLRAGGACSSSAAATRSSKGAIDAAFSIEPRAPGADEDALRRLGFWLFHEKWHVFADASTAFRLPGHGDGGAGHLGDLPLRRPRLEPPRGSRRRRALRADAARLLPRAPGVLRRPHHGDVDPVRLRALARAGEAQPGMDRGRRASSSASRSRPSTTRGSCPSSSCHTRSSCSAMRSWRALKAGRLACRAASFRWPSSGPSSSSRYGRTSGTTRWLAWSGG